ncbi:MAG: ketopantoate reductase family protein [Candidatus Thorarchaeota archaeon]
MIQSILFYGAGSIGSLFAGILCKSGPEISMIAREPHATYCNNKGLTIHDVVEGRIKNTCPISSAALLSDLQQEINLDPDIVIVSCKAYDNEYAAIDLQRLINKNENTKIILLQNGVGNEEIFYEYYDPERIYRIITSEGALLVSPANVIHGGKGQTYIGNPKVERKDQISTEIAGLFSDAGIETYATDQINKQIWTKCLINSPINPIATLNNVKNGELIKRPNLKELVINVIDETLKVFRGRKIDFSHSHDPFEAVFNVVKNTSENKCSMLQDIERGRQTEIDFLNGRIVREANIENIDVPYNFSLYNEIKRLEFSQKIHRNISF